MRNRETSRCFLRWIFLGVSCVFTLPLLAQTDMPGFSLKMPDVKPAKKPKSEKWAFSLLPVGLQRNPQVDYTIVTEMTDEGRKLPDPSFSNPVYYIAHSQGQTDVGRAYGGTRPVQFAYLEMQLYSSLASNGYRRVDPERPDPEHPPTQVLFFTWGMFNNGINEDSEFHIRGNLNSRAKLIGGQKFAEQFAQALRDDRAWGGGGPNGHGPMRDFAERDETTETLVYAVYNECYYLLVTSLEVEALTQHQRKVLWTTKITTIAQGVNFKATLPIMIQNASYFFGRETNGPEILTKRAYKRANVEIGEATVVEFAPSTSGTTSTSGTATRKR